MSGHVDKTAGRVPDELVDKFFDRELDEGSRETFFGMLRGDLARCAEVAKTQRIVTALREPIPGPDVTARVMGRMARRRGFLPERWRRVVTAGRLAAAIVVLLGVLAIAVAHRVAPEMFRLGPESPPLTNLIKAGSAETIAGVVSLRGGAPAPEPAARRPLLSLSTGKSTVVTLAHPAESAIAVPRGAGAETRFVFVGGECVDQKTMARVAVVAGSAEGTCPEALEMFIRRMATEAGGGQGGIGPVHR